MDIDRLGKKIKPYLTPLNLTVFFVVLALLVISGVVLFQRLSPKKGGEITEDQIKIQKGEKIVIIDKNGLVEYRTSEGVFYEVWDSAKINDFFTSMEEKAREYLANPNPEACSVGYAVTLYIDGRETTICLEDDEELDEVFEEFTQGEGQISLSDLFDDLFDDEGEEGNGTTLTGTPTPTPTPLIVSSEEGEDVPPGGGGEDGGQTLPDCILYEELVTGRTVISNTLCVARPTPTPTP